MFRFTPGRDCGAASRATFGKCPDLPDHAPIAAAAAKPRAAMQLHLDEVSQNSPIGCVLELCGLPRSTWLAPFALAPRGRTPLQVQVTRGFKTLKVIGDGRGVTTQCLVLIVA